MTYRIKAEWLTDCETDEQVKERTDFIVSSRAFRDLLKSLLEKRIQGLEKRGMSEEDYKEPELLARMAFRNGQMSALFAIYELLQVTKGD
jgi:hypothetical protein